MPPGNLPLYWSLPVLVVAQGNAANERLADSTAAPPGALPRIWIPTIAVVLGISLAALAVFYAARCAPMRPRRAPPEEAQVEEPTPKCLACDGNGCGLCGQAAVQVGRRSLSPYPNPMPFDSRRKVPEPVEVAASSSDTAVP